MFIAIMSIIAGISLYTIIDKQAKIDREFGVFDEQ